MNTGAASHTSPRPPRARPGALPRWLHSRWVPALAATAGAVVVAAALGFVAYQRAELRAAAWARADLYAHVLEDQANRTFSDIEVALDAVATSLSQAPASNEKAPVLAQALLARSLLGLPFLRSISLVAADGTVLASSNPANLGLTVPMARLHPGSNLLGPLLPVRDLHGLSRPGADLHSQLLPLLRALPRGLAHGRLTGAWLVVAINPEYFANQYQLILRQAPLKAAMLSYQGQLIAASDNLRLVPGDQLPEHPIFSQKLPGLAQGEVDGPGLDGAPAVAVFRSARRQPLVLVAEVPDTVVKAQLGAVLRGTAAGTAGVLLLLGALAALTWRSLRSHEAAQHDLDSARDTMAAQHAFTDRLFQLNPIPTVVKDTAGRLVRVNRAWCAFTGLTAEASVGRHLRDLYPPALASAHALQEELAVTTQQPVAYEAQLTDAKRRRRDVMIRAVPYADADGRSAGVIVCLMDVSEFREAEARTLEAKAAAERANAAKSEFLANISHELRTPLQTIIGFSELGSMRARIDPRGPAMFADIQSAGQRMLALVNDLLDLSRLESGTDDVQLRATDLAPALQAVLAELAPLAKQHGLAWQVEADDAPLWAQADLPRVQQVLRNVLLNAIRFAPAGSEVQVLWRSPAPDQHVIQVRDHGPGIPPTELEGIFDAFVQSSRTKNGAGGTGLGLAVCRKIMRAHGGTISADNAPGGGAVFTITLPAVSQPVAASATAQRGGQA